LLATNSLQISAAKSLWRLAQRMVHNKSHPTSVSSESEQTFAQN